MLEIGAGRSKSYAMESIYKMDNIDNIYQTDATEEKEDEEEAEETDEGGNTGKYHLLYKSSVLSEMNR